MHVLSRKNFATYTHNHFVVITEVNLSSLAQPVMYWRI